MEKCRFNSMLSNNKLEYGGRLNKSMGSLDAIGHTSEGEEPTLPNKDNVHKKIPSWSGIHYSDSLFENILSLLSDDTLLVRDSNGDSYSVYFDIENQILEIDNTNYFFSEQESNSGAKNSNYYYYFSMYDTQSNWKNHITSCIDSYLPFEISLSSDIYRGIGSYIYSLICKQSISSIESLNSSIKTQTKSNPFDSSNDFDSSKYKHLWVLCENCYGLNYKKFFRSRMNICEYCGYHLKMSSSDQIKFIIDPGTWEPIGEDMVSMDPIEFHSEDDPYMDRIDFYQRETDLTEAVQTGIGQLDSIPIAIGVMDFRFMGGSMGSIVGERITRLIEYATNKSLPVIIVCASGGARMQEGSLSLMQMAKISSASYDYQSNKKLFYISILTSPTTGGVTASFGMLGDIIIAEPNAYIAFAGKRVIEETLKQKVPEGSQVAEYSFPKGLFDPIVPRNLLKGVLSELFQLQGFLPLNQGSKKY